MHPVTDTSAAAEAVRLAAVRARSPEARLRDALALSDVTHALIMTRLRSRFPERSVVELALHLGGDPAGGDASP